MLCLRAHAQVLAPSRDEASLSASICKVDADGASVGSCHYVEPEPKAFSATSEMSAVRCACAAPALRNAEPRYICMRHRASHTSQHSSRASVCHISTQHLRASRCVRGTLHATAHRLRNATALCMRHRATQYYRHGAAQHTAHGVRLTNDSPALCASFNVVRRRRGASRCS